jgi:hypothetical protein
MTGPVRSKDMRGHALRTKLSFRSPVSDEWQDADLSGCDGAIFSFGFELQNIALILCTPRSIV